MASAAHITPENRRTTSYDLKARADALTCLLDLLTDNLAALRAGVRDQGEHALQLHEWHLADVLLNLAAEQAAFVSEVAYVEK